ncbi:MAG: succinylglutamate desuccinylase, partial [Achromobacter sp.]|nr:succinylglutamate desuccinylase [Achromobacter sp.]
SVAARQRIGRLIEPARPATPPPALVSPQAGTVVCLRAIARSGDGDCLVQIAPALPLDSLSSRY